MAVFWDRRVQDSGMFQSETCIPQVPDQTAFINAWFEWHQRYRTLRQPDGTVENQVLIGEPLGEVDLGCLPRTAADLRNGWQVSSEQVLIRDAQQREEQLRRRSEDQHPHQHIEPDPIPEEDRLFDDSDSEQEEPQTAYLARVEAIINSIVPDPRMKRHVGHALEVTASELLSREIPADRRRDLLNYTIYGPDLEGYLEEITPQLYMHFRSALLAQSNLIGRDLANSMHQNSSQARRPQSSQRRQTSGSTQGPVPQPINDTDIALPVPLNREYINTLSPSRNQVLIRQYTSDLELLRRRQQQIAPLGTREDVEDPTYVSPIATMFSNFQSWHLQRLAARRRQQGSLRERLEGDANMLPGAIGEQEQSRSQGIGGSQASQRFSHGVHHTSGESTPSQPPEPTGHTRPLPAWSEDLETTRRHSTSTDSRNEPSQSLPEASTHYTPRFSRLLRPRPTPSLDDPTDGRPPPLNDDQMVVKLQCCICISQLAQIAVLPCGMIPPHFPIIVGTDTSRPPRHVQMVSKPLDPKSAERTHCSGETGCKVSCLQIQSKEDGKSKGVGVHGQRKLMRIVSYIRSG
jgi:hypothetical protein